MSREIAADFPVDMQALEACKQISDPLVSIGILVYNQKKYIKSAIESILVQEVDFNYEIVIADDCSTDGTQNILIEYANKYPQIIRLILQEQNVGLQENSKCLKRACRGRYRATQEGDDYWINTDRLQQQVDFLSENPDYIAVCGGLIAADANGRPTRFPWGGIADSYKLEGDYELADFENWKLPCHVGAWLSYNIFATINTECFEQYEGYGVPGDRKTPLYSMLYGKIRIISEKYMVRRILWNSKTSHINSFKKTSPPARVFSWALEAQKMDNEFTHLGLNMMPTLERMFLSTFRDMARQPSRFHFKACCKVFWSSGHKLHFWILFNKKIAAKFRRKLKKEGIIRGLAGTFKALFKAVKKVLFKS